MAVHCGVCAVRLFDATENEGSFQVGSLFTSGWDLKQATSGKPCYRIDDTCEDCAHVLRVAIAERAHRIAEDNQERIMTLRKACEDAREREAKAKADRAAFEASWRANRAKQ